jgi:hypothetical protein
MKKPSKRNVTEISGVAVSAFLEEPEVLQRLVEKLAHRSEEYLCSELLHDDWEPIQFSSLEGYANGGLVLSDAKELVNSIFDTCFLFTCTRIRNTNYQLTWVCSHS